MDQSRLQPLEQFQPNVFSSACPTRLILDRIADKWTVLVLVRLIEQPLRFNALKRSIEGVSQKMLSQTLRQLERDGLISRAVFPTVPVSVEYAITPLGQTLAQVVEAVRDWAEAHIDAVAAAQHAYDRRAGAALRQPS